MSKVNNVFNDINNNMNFQVIYLVLNSSYLFESYGEKINYLDLQVYMIQDIGLRM